MTTFRKMTKKSKKDILGGATAGSLDVERSTVSAFSKECFALNFANATGVRIAKRELTTNTVDHKKVDKKRLSNNSHV
jgi:hypothetical protein